MTSTTSHASATSKTVWVWQRDSFISVLWAVSLDPSRFGAYLCFSLIVKCENVVSPSCLALSDQKHSMTIRSRALDQVGGLDARDGPVEPGVREQEVICFLDDLLRWAEGDGIWRVRCKNNLLFIYRSLQLAGLIKMFPVIYIFLDHYLEVVSASTLFRRQQMSSINSL